MDEAMKSTQDTERNASRGDSQQNGLENQQYGWKINMMEEFIKASELFRCRVENKHKCWKQKCNK